MKRILLMLPLLIVAALAIAQPSSQVTVVGAVTPGHCTTFLSTLQLADSGINCPSGTFGSPFQVGNGATQNPIQINAGGAGQGSIIGNFSAPSVDANPFINFEAKGTGSFNFLGNQGGTNLFQINGSTTAVNFMETVPAATGVTPQFFATGSDTNVGYNSLTKGNGSFGFFSNTGSNEVFQINGSTTAVNFLTVTPANAASFPVFSTSGSDTNIGIGLTTKGNASVNIVSTGGNSGALQLLGSTSGGAGLLTGATGGHLQINVNGGVAPSLTAGCNGAGSAVNGNDIVAQVVGQTAAATTCTITFGTAFAAQPRCQVTGFTTPVTSVSMNTTTLVITFASTANYQWNYLCIGT